MEYRMSLYNRFLILLVAAVGGVGGMVVVSAAFRGVSVAPMVGLGLFLIVFAACFGLEAIRFRLVIDGDSLTVTHVFSSRSVLLDEIAGYRTGSKGTVWLDLKSGARALTISNSMERQEEFLEWLRERYPDIDAERAREVKSEVLHDERFGDTEEERAGRLKKAWRLMFYSALTPSLLIWVLIKPQPIRLLMMILLAIPILAVWLTWYYKGILRLFVSNRHPYPSLMIAIIGAAVLALIAVSRVYDIYLFSDHDWFLIAGCAIALTLLWAVVCRAAIPADKNPIVFFGGMLLIAGVYSYSALLFVNCAYDAGTPEKWKVGVDRKHAAHGKSTTYYLKLSPWGRYDAGKAVIVDHRFYDSVAVGDSVDVLIHPGACGISWYEVTSIPNR